MLLSVLDRLILLNVLPTEGDLTTIKIVGDLRNSLSFSEDEHEVLQFNEEGEQLHWEEGVSDKDITLGTKAHMLVAGVLEQLSTDKKLTADHLPIYEKFVEDSE